MMLSKLYILITVTVSVYLNNLNQTAFLISSYQPVAKIQTQTVLQKSMAKGKDVYIDFCLQCHMANGKGDGLNFPPLDGSNWLKKKRSEIIYVVKYGQSGEIVVNNKNYNNTMPAPVGLSNQEVADVMNYIQNSWSNKNRKIVTEKEVRAVSK